MSTQALTSPKALFRQLLRVQRDWPAQEKRQARASVYLLNRIQRGFRPSGVEDSIQKASRPPSIVPSPSVVTTELSIADGQRELAALKRILSNDIRIKHGLKSESAIIKALPEPHRYALLDTDVKEAEKKLGMLQYLRVSLTAPV